MTQGPGSSSHAVARDRHVRLRRLSWLSRLLDEWMRIPGTSYRVGLDGLIGFVPGVGDAVGAMLSAYILYEAIKLGLPASTLIRMGGNIALETVVGSIPLVGDVFDVAWKANKKNLALINAALKNV